MMQLTSCSRAVEGKFQGIFFWNTPCNCWPWGTGSRGMEACIFLPDGLKDVRGDLKIVVGWLKGGVAAMSKTCQNGLKLYKSHLYWIWLGFLCGGLEILTWTQFRHPWYIYNVCVLYLSINQQRHSIGNTSKPSSWHNETRRLRQHCELRTLFPEFRPFGAVTVLGLCPLNKNQPIEGTEL